MLSFIRERPEGNSVIKSKSRSWLPNLQYFFILFTRSRLNLNCRNLQLQTILRKDTTGSQVILERCRPGTSRHRYYLGAAMLITSKKKTDWKSRRENLSVDQCSRKCQATDFTSPGRLRHMLTFNGKDAKLLVHMLLICIFHPLSLEALDKCVSCSRQRVNY